MDVHHPLQLLAGLSPSQFMRRHWQKKPLLVREAIPGFQPLLSRAALFGLAGRQGVESRLIVHEARKWRMAHGPFKAKSLPPLSQKAWTLLVQGVDLHDAGAHALLQDFRFVPDARMDDLMISFATAGGGVGPHFDSYDVFLLQASGRRRWRIGRQQDLSLQSGVPLKILKHFEPEEEFVLEAGDMLYLPPRYAHDGVALAGAKGQADDCMTYSIGFRAPAMHELGAELLHRLAEFSDEAGGDPAPGASADAPTLYRDKAQLATATPAALPAGLVDFAGKAVMQALKDPLAVACALGEYMTEPKPSVWFDEPDRAWDGNAARSGRCEVRLDARTRMMYDTAHVFINGESYRAKGADATLMRQLADLRGLEGRRLSAASPAALDLLAEWHDAGWLYQLC